MGSHLVTPLELSLEGIEIKDTEALETLATNICKVANEAGIFLHEGDPERDRVTIKQAKRAAKDWLKAVRKQIDEMSEAEAQRLLPSYDTLHRLAYGQPADSAFINKHVMAAFESRIRGNKAVDPYLLYRQINAGIRRRDPIYFGRPLAWQTTILDRWYKDLTTSSPQNMTTGGGHASDAQASHHGKETDDPLYHLLQKAAILMEADLYVYEGTNQTAFKQSLFTTHSSLFYNAQLFNHKTLEALKKFILSSRRYIPRELFITIQNVINNALVA